MMNTISHDRARLLELLTALSFERKAVTLSSGRTSNFYVDCKQTTLHPEGQVLVGRILFRELKLFEERRGSRIGGIGGLTLGADPIACSVALTSTLAGSPFPAFVVRKEPKGHGTEQYIEGLSNLTPGDKLAVVEDVITTGGSALRAIERVRAAGFVVPLVFALVDRQEGGREKIEEAEVEVVSIYTKEDFMPQED